MQVPDKALGEEPCNGAKSPVISEPSSPAMPDTPLLDEETDWEENDTFYVKPNSKRVRILDAERLAGTSDEEGN